MQNVNSLELRRACQLVAIIGVGSGMRASNEVYFLSYSMCEYFLFGVSERYPVHLIDTKNIEDDTDCRQKVSIRPCHDRIQ